MKETVDEGVIKVGAGRTWYRVHRGDGAANDAAPLVTLHGGPGASLDEVPFIAPVLGGARGVRSITTSGSPLRLRDYPENARRARAALPRALQQALDECEK